MLKTQETTMVRPQYEKSTQEYIIIFCTQNEILIIFLCLCISLVYVMFLLRGAHGEYIVWFMISWFICCFN